MQIRTTTLAVLSTLIPGLLADESGVQLVNPDPDAPLDLSAKSVQVAWTVDEGGFYAGMPRVAITWKGRAGSPTELGDDLITIYDGPNKNGSNEITWDLNDYVEEAVASKQFMESEGFLNFNFYTEETDVFDVDDFAFPFEIEGYPEDLISPGSRVLAGWRSLVAAGLAGVGLLMV